MHKRARYADRLAAADPALRLRDVHLLVGGTGAVGGESLIKMVKVYGDLARCHGVAPEEDGPVLVATGRVRNRKGDMLNELRRFKTRLWNMAEAAYGESPTATADTVRMPTGVMVYLQEFSIEILPRLSAAGTGAEELERYVEEICGADGTLHAAIAEEIRRGRQLSDLLTTVRQALAARGPRWSFDHFRSIQLGIPLPSLLAYHLDSIQNLQSDGHLTAEEADDLKGLLSRQIGDELSRARSQADAVLVAHTTAVGGMYDPTQDGTRIRLGFAHAARDAFLAEKRLHAERMSKIFADAGTWNLITAAAVGIDEVRVHEPLDLQLEMRRALQRAADEPFPGARNAQHLHVCAPVTLSLAGDGKPPRPVRFERMARGGELRPRFQIRSGENGYLSPANAEALYRVMRVASPSELGAVMALVGALGDDPFNPWFQPVEGSPGRECYYTETDNSRLVFDFLAQPSIRETQLSGLEPQAYVDLGSAKHQGELHTLGLLTLLHRLRTLDLDAVPVVVEPKRFDAELFVAHHSRQLTFEDLQDWEIDELERDLVTLVLAESADDLRALRDFRAPNQDHLAPQRAQARDLILERFVAAVQAVSSLGSPIVVERDGTTVVRCGWWVAPLSLLVDSTDSLRRWFADRRAELAAQGVDVPLDDLVDHHLAVNGFIDLRPHALVATSTHDRDAAGRVHRAGSEEELRRVVAALPPFQFVASCGLLALIYRLRGLATYLQAAQMGLGTSTDAAWAMPRERHGHTLLVPGIVEAFRMVSEGLEKSTGTEILDGYWGYWPTPRPG